MNSSKVANLSSTESTLKSGWVFRKLMFKVTRFSSISKKVLETESRIEVNYYKPILVKQIKT